MIPTRGSMVSPPCLATSISASVAARHSGASCSRFGSLMMQVAASRRVVSVPPWRACVLMRSEFGSRSRQKLPVLSLFLPVHQDVKIGRALLAVGDGLTFAHPVESHDRGGGDDADLGIFVFQRQPLRFSVGSVGYEGRLVLDVAVRVAVAKFGRAKRGEC